jgi:hypothetical protein
MSTDDWQSNGEKLFVGTPYATFRRLRELVAWSIQLEALSILLKRDFQEIRCAFMQLYQRST